MHTPGPWAIRKWSKSESGIVATVNGKSTDIYGYAFNENAHLIAAAPDLLEALQEARSMLMLAVEAPELIEQIDAAIAKATGETC